jgi:hypothetical protein
MKHIELTDHVQNVAITTAFLYAGALTPDQETDKFEAWEGHQEFVRACTGYAHAIETWLGHPGRYDDNHPGVLAYEVIEPLGYWLVLFPHAEALPLDTATVLQEFQRRYLDWIKDTDGIKPTDRVVAHDGTVIQDGRRVINTKNYEILLDVSGTKWRGCFEHTTLGDESAGELWYDDKKNLHDYDGVYELPKEVRDALKADGFTSTEGCLDD